MARRLLDRLLLLSVAGLAGAALLAEAGRWSPWLDLLGHFRLQYAWAALLLAALLLIRRRRGPALAAVLVLAVQGWHLLPLIPPPSGDGAAGLRVVSLNLRYDNMQVDRAVDYLLGSGADIVAVHEALHHWPGALERLSAAYPHRLEQPVDWLGTMLFAKKPWAAGENRMLPFKLRLAWARFGEGSEALTVVTVHPTTPFWTDEQPGQYGAMAEIIAALPGRKLVLGDFNQTPWSPLMRDLAERTGLRPASLWPSFPAWLPPPLRIPIDNAMATPGLIRRAATGPAVGSDHLPIEVELAP
ncbi:MAG TPA: endonuclease/exonuclease/phosphatase family protein [Caulobacter sp.]|nr:endonuclease/exonuclease/phosphatase family protein [Caulobacter sp.]